MYVLNMGSEQAVLSFRSILANQLVHMFLAQPAADDNDGSDDADDEKGGSDDGKYVGNGGYGARNDDGDSEFDCELECVKSGGTTGDDAHCHGDGEEHKIKNFVPESSVLSK